MGSVWTDAVRINTACRMVESEAPVELGAIRVEKGFTQEAGAEVAIVIQLGELHFETVRRFHSSWKPSLLGK